MTLSNLWKGTAPVLGFVALMPTSPVAAVLSAAQGTATGGVCTVARIALPYPEEACRAETSLECVIRLAVTAANQTERCHRQIGSIGMLYSVAALRNRLTPTTVMKAAEKDFIEHAIKTYARMSPGSDRNVAGLHIAVSMSRALRFDADKAVIKTLTPDLRVSSLAFKAYRVARGCEFEKSRLLIRRALVIYRRIHVPTRRIAALYRLARVRGMIGEFDRALEMMDYAVELSRQPRVKRDRAIRYIAEGYGLLGEYRKALDFASRIGRDSYHRGMAYSRIAHYQGGNGHRPRARASIPLALAAISEGLTYYQQDLIRSNIAKATALSHGYGEGIRLARLIESPHPRAMAFAEIARSIVDPPPYGPRAICDQ